MLINSLPICIYTCILHYHLFPRETTEYWMEFENYLMDSQPMTIWCVQKADAWWLLVHLADKTNICWTSGKQNVGSNVLQLIAAYVGLWTAVQYWIPVPRSFFHCLFIISLHHWMDVWKLFTRYFDCYPKPTEFIGIRNVTTFTELWNYLSSK